MTTDNHDRLQPISRSDSPEISVWAYAGLCTALVIFIVLVVTFL